MRSFIWSLTLLLSILLTVQLFLLICENMCICMWFYKCPCCCSCMYLHRHIILIAPHTYICITLKNSYECCNRTEFNLTLPLVLAFCIYFYKLLFSCCLFIHTFYYVFYYYIFFVVFILAKRNIVVCALELSFNAILFILFAPLLLIIINKYIYIYFFCEHS